MARLTLLAARLALALCSAHAVAAQTPAQIQPGTRVRLTIPEVSPNPFVGVVDSVDDRSLTVRTSGAARSSFRLASVSRLEVSHGRKRPTWSLLAPLWMTAAGGGAGAVIGYAITPTDDYFGPEFGAAVLGSLGGALGLLVGTTTAIVVKRDVWEPVDMKSANAGSAPPSLYVAPAGRGVRLGIRATF